MAKYRIKIPDTRIDAALAQAEEIERSGGSVDNLDLDKMNYVVSFPKDKSQTRVAQRTKTETVKLLRRLGFSVQRKNVYSNSAAYLHEYIRGQFDFPGRVGEIDKDNKVKIIYQFGLDQILDGNYLKRVCEHHDIAHYEHFGIGTEILRAKAKELEEIADRSEQR